MKTLYLIRHTRPDIPPGVCYGQLDIDVADSFKTEVANITSLLPPLDLIIASPLRRTRRLAETLAADRIRFDARLMEKHFGAWEGLPWDDIDRNEIDAWVADVVNYHPPGGESAQQVLLRVQGLLNDLAEQPQHNIALVAHGGTIRAILSLIAGIPLAITLNWQIDYGAVIAVRI